MSCSRVRWCSVIIKLVSASRMALISERTSWLEEWIAVTTASELLSATSTVVCSCFPCSSALCSRVCSFWSVTESRASMDTPSLTSSSVCEIPNSLLCVSFDVIEGQLSTHELMIPRASWVVSVRAPCLASGSNLPDGIQRPIVGRFSSSYRSHHLKGHFEETLAATASL